MKFIIYVITLSSATLAADYYQFNNPIVGEVYSKVKAASAYDPQRCPTPGAMKCDSTSSVSFITCDGLTGEWVKRDCGVGTHCVTQSSTQILCD
jgi:hypothetical protein